MSLFKKGNKNNILPKDKKDENEENTTTTNKDYEYGTYQLTDEDISINYINNNILSEDNNDILNVLDIDYIDDYKYKYMDKVTVINLLSYVSNIGKESFSFCEELTDFNFTAECDNLTINDFAFQYCYKLKHFNFKGNISKLGQGAFSNCKCLESINLTGLDIIDMNAFLLANSLSNVIMPDVEIIKSGAFLFCKSLSNINLQASTKLHTIESFAFSGCNLQKLTIPNSVRYIHGYAFENNFNLTDVYFETNKDSIIDLGEDIFKNNKNVIIHTQNKDIVEYCKKFKYNYTR